jgi:YVTN family beta-propeller protein
LQKKLLFLTLNYIVFVMVVIFSNNAHAQELHEKTLYEIANQTPSNETSAIPVGKDPYAIGVNWLTNTVYVGNRGDNTVSVINGMTNTKIKDISVGKYPVAIGFNWPTNTIYVAIDLIILYQ